MSTFTVIAEKVKTTLSETIDDSSVAKVSTGNTEDRDADSYISNTVDFHLSADADERHVWVNISAHTYASAGMGKPSFTTNADYISRHFTETEARVLLELLTHELAKLD